MSRPHLPGLVPHLPEADGADVAAVLVPIFPDAGGVHRLLLTKRPMTMPTHAGHLAFPGGRPDPDDQSPIDTALREAHEEVGVDPSLVEVLGFLRPIHTVEFTLFVVPVVGWMNSRPDFIPSEREVDRLLEPSLDELADPGRWRYEVWRGRRVWFFDIGDEVLWGATASMTRLLLGLET